MILWIYGLVFAVNKPYLQGVSLKHLILIPLPQLEMMKDKQRPFPNKGEDILPFEKMKEQRMRERIARVERVRRAVELRRYTFGCTEMQRFIYWLTLKY